MTVIRTLHLAWLLLLVHSLTLAQQPTKEWTIDDIFASSKFAFKSLSSVQWVENGKKFSYMETDTVSRTRSLFTYDVATGERQLVMSGALLVGVEGEKPMRIGSYAWSSDGMKILVTGSLPARRTKTGGHFGVFDVATRKFRLLSDTSAEQAIIKFSPDGSKIGFVRENDLYVMDVATGNETRLTFDGSENIINGKFDWVYEEEFGIIDGWQWSPDGRRIAFWRLDQSNVPTFPLIYYPEDEAHPEIETMHYPKPGDPNSVVKIGICDVSTAQTIWLDLGSNPDIYIPRIQWTNDPEILSVQRLNRGQDTLDLMMANAGTGEMRTILTETDSAWVDVTDNLTFLKDSDRFLWTSWRDGWMHIYLYNNDGSLVRQVTKGEWEVTKIAGVNEKRNLVYLESTQASHLQRHLYSIKLDGTGMRRITGDAGWHRINLAPDASVFIDSYSNATSPSDVTLRTNDGTPMAKLIDNDLSALEGYPVTSHEFFTFKNSTGVELNGYMLKPADFDPAKKYPVLMHVYGLGGQTVTDQWGGRNFLWYQLLAQHGYIIASVDNRGMEGRGRAFREVGYLKFGIPEIEDQMDAAKYLASLPYIDGSRIGIWGWSGGGFMTCLAMTYGAEVFKTGVAVASVTHWKFYDTIYTERYMDTPEHNPEGYKESSPITYADKLKGNFLILHGTADDNVHWQNTIVLVNQLIHENKQFQTMFYPGHTHGIHGDNASRHLYTKMTEFILGNL